MVPGFKTCPQVTRRIRSDALKLLAFLACTLVLGALLAPAMYNIGKAIVGFRMFDGYLNKVLEESDFGRYFNRAMLLAALICLIPLLRSLRLRRTELGLVRNPNKLLHLGGGFLLAGGLLLLMGWVYLKLGLFRAEIMKEGVLVAYQDWSWSKVGLFLQQGFGASILEELIFRCALLGVVLRSARPLTALLFISFFFAIVHFLKPPEGLVIADGDVGFGTGFYMVGQIFANFGNPVFILAEFTTLFAVGLVLGWARLRTCSLWLPIGLHAGWVFSLKLFNYHTFVPGRYRPDLLPPYVGIDLKTGLIPLTVVCLTGVIAAILLRLGSRRRLSRSESNHEPQPA